MSKDNENKLVPKLRFKEFINEKWERKTIDETCEVLNNLRKPLTSNLREKGEFPYYGASGIIDYVKDCIFNERLLLIGEDGAKWGAYEKTAFIAEGKYWVNNHAHVLKPTGVVDTLLENYLVKLDISPFITGAAPPKLTLGKLKSIPVPIPNSKKEQQKIASCLSSLDEVITAESQKLEALKDHKKGLLQNLFPKLSESEFTELKNEQNEFGKFSNPANPDSDNVPKLRFKEFENSGEWVEKKLREVAEVITGNTPSTSKKDYYGGDKMLVSPADIDGNRFIVEAKTNLTDLGFSKTRKIRANSVLFVCIGSTIGKVAQNKFECATNQQINSLVPFKEYSSAFLYSLLEANFQKITSLAGKQAVPLINKTTFSLVKLPIPPSPAEQQKIASCLSSLDDLITAQNQKIETLLQHKKGLLQGLFPNVNTPNLGELESGSNSTPLKF